MWVIPLNADEPYPAVDGIGGKADGLRRLHRAGFRVPKAYVVTTAAYRHSLAPRLMGLKRPEAMAKAALGAALPVELERDIRALHESTFNGNPVAVRSSAVSEDGERHSFAGQLESSLDVVGSDAVIGAIKGVWASFFGRSNLLYRGRVSLDDSPSSVAVVVQEMIQPRAAGVMFTADPMGGDASRGVISATAGLGDKVVDGRSAETVYFDIERGAVERHVPSEPGAPLALTASDIELLASVAREINRRFGRPQDVEWAFDEKGLAFLQCRPITTGSAMERRGPSVWSNVNVGEALPGVGTPMTWSIIRSFSRRGFEKAFGALGLSVPEHYELVASFRGRVYLNLTQFASVVSSIPFMRIKDFLEAGGGAEADEVERHGYEKRSKLRFLAKLPVSVTRMAVSQLSTPLRARRWAKAFGRRRRHFNLRNLEVLSKRELLEQLEELDDLFDRTGVIMLAAGSNFLSSYIATQKLLRRWGGDSAAAKEQYLFSGLRGLASAEPGLALLDMARFVRRSPDLTELFAHTPSSELMQALSESGAGRELQDHLDRFLEEHGHRAAREAEISTPRWNETPLFLLDVIRSHLEAPFLPASETVQDQGERVRQETTEMIRQYFRPGLGVAFRWVLGRAQINARLREQLRSAVTDTLAMYRRFFLEIGRRLAAERVLAEADDVFFLSRDEVVAYLKTGLGTVSMALWVATRRAEYVAFSEAAAPPDTFVLDGNESIPQASRAIPDDAPTLNGLAASPGRVTGPARVINDLSVEANLHPGEILVAPFTDVGWTPLFLVAAAVVTDLGGPLSHSSVVAREYGIPAVVNTKEGTQVIKTGDLITVDGDAGRVYLKT